MPTDLDDKHAAGTVKPVGSDALGNETDFVQVDSVNGNRRLVGRSSIVSEDASPVAVGVTVGGRLMVDASASVTGAVQVKNVAGTIINPSTEDTLATRLADATYTGRVGEVQASPTANTVLARLKDIVTQMTTQVRGLFDSAGNALTTISAFTTRRLDTVNMEWLAWLVSNGQGYSCIVEDANLTPANTYDPALLFRNPVGSGKTALIQVIVYAETSSTSARIIFELSANPTVTANGTARTIVNNSLGGAAGVCLVNQVPTVTARGVSIEENIVAASGTSIERFHRFDLQVPAGNSLLISGKAGVNNKTVTVSIKWVEV